MSDPQDSIQNPADAAGASADAAASDAAASDAAQDASEQAAGAASNAAGEAGTEAQQTAEVAQQAAQTGQGVARAAESGDAGAAVGAAQQGLGAAGGVNEAVGGSSEAGQALGAAQQAAGAAQQAAGATRQAAGATRQAAGATRHATSQPSTPRSSETSPAGASSAGASSAGASSAGASSAARSSSAGASSGTDGSTDAAVEAAVQTLASADEHAQCFFEASALAPETFHVVEFVARDTLSQTFQVDLDLVSEDGAIDFADLVNQAATVFIVHEGERRPIHGVVSNVQQRERASGWVRYQVTLVPRVWALSLTTQSRVFLESTVEEIIQEVLEGSGLGSSDFRFELSAAYPMRDYCVQYRETDLAFISRLMEHEGICFFFVHEDGRDVLVMTDDRTTFPRVLGTDAVVYNSGDGMVATDDADAISDVVCREQLVPGRVLLRDYNDETPDTEVVGESQINDEMPGLYYEYGAHVADAEQSGRIAQVRNEEIESRRRVLTMKSGHAGMRGGHVFTLEEHYRPDFNDDYLVTEVVHRGSHAGGIHGTTGQPSYRNEFTCIPASVPYRPPRRTPVPTIPGLTVARTETTGGDYAFLDEQGRYHAKMNFDTSETQPGAGSTAIRMRQANSGPGYGIHFPNHADTELLVAHINGDVDRPLALGTVPNPSQQSPVTSENKTQNVIRTYAGNQVLIDDLDGSTKIVLSTTGGHSVSLDDGGPKITVSTSGGHSLTLDDDLRVARLLTTDGYSVVLSDADELMTLMTKNGHTVVLDDAHELIRVGSTGGSEVILHDADQLARVQSASGHKVELNDPASSITVEGASGGNVVTIDDGGGDVTTESTTSINLQCGASSISLDSGGNIDIEGQKVTINGMSITLDAQVTCAVKAGVKAEMAGGGGATLVTADPSAVSLSGPMINVNGQGPVNVTSAAMVAITGTMVKLN